MLTQRLKTLALLGILGGLSLPAFAEKDGKNAVRPGSGAQTVQAPAAAAAEEPAAGDLEAVAKATGFAKYLPQTTHAYAGVFDGKGFLAALRASKLLKLLEAEAAKQGGFNFDEFKESPEAAMVLALFAEEFFVAVGDKSPEQFANLVTLNESSTRESMAAMVELLDQQLSGKAPEEGAGGQTAMMMMLFGGFLKDPAAGMPVLEKVTLPPVTLGFKVSDADVRGQLAGIANDGLTQFLEMAGPDGEDVAEAVSVKRGESEFKGIRIVGKKVAGKMNADVREQMSAMMDAKTVDELIKIIEQKNIVVVVGTHGDYLVGFAGADVEDLKIAASPAESLLARPELAFMDSYGDKKLLALMSMSKDLQDRATQHTTLLGSMALGIKKGLSKAKSFGDTEDLETLLGLVAEQEKELLGLSSYTPAGAVVFLEEGLKVETYGGSNMPDLDLEAPRKYASVGMAEDIFLFSNWVEAPAYTEKMLEYFDSIGQTLYLGAKGASKLEIEEQDFGDFKEGFGLFDERLRPHLLEVWNALRGDLVAGLGAEGALIVDLKGGLPTVPGLPQIVIDQGKAPRIGVLAPVADKERLSQSWKRIDKSVSELLKVVSEMSGEQIPMQRPMSSEKNELKTWFFAFPFQTDDFVLSVSMDEKNFFASTSKSFVQSLSADLAKAEVDPAQKGVHFHMNIVLLHAYLLDWVKLLDANAGAIFGEESPAAEDFKNGLPMIKQALAGVSELKSIKGHLRNEDGIVRGSLHIQTGH